MEQLGGMVGWGCWQRLAEDGSVEGTQEARGEIVEWRKEGMGRGTLASVTPGWGGWVHGCMQGGREWEQRW